MLNLKSIYFYFLALQITLIKFLKKIYFSTSYYNESLKSRTPQQFYFHPNPFLLSLITSYKKNSFKISEIDSNFFWIKQKDILEEKKIHSFLWLNLIDRKSDGKSLQKIIYIWNLKHSKYKKNIWENSILSKRIISWLLNVDIILNNGSFDFKKKFLNSIISQTNHLKKNIKFEKNFSKRLEVLIALTLSGLVFKEYIDNYNVGIKELEKLVKNYFDEDGFPLSRNPGDLIFFSKYLLLCKECIRDAQQYVPEFLDTIIDKNLICIKSILTPNEKIPLFNGAIEENLEQLNQLTSDLKYKSKNKKKVIGGINVFNYKNNVVFFDIGGPPKKSFSRSYQSGPLSFEYYLDGNKIITNCGFGLNISHKAELLSRLTSAQSTLTLNDTSVTKFERNKIINKIFGNSIKDSFKVFDTGSIEIDKHIKVFASHNGYEKKFGCIHKRTISIDKKNYNLIGCDELMKKKDGKPLNYSIRFHLYPGLTAVKTIGGNSVLIQISKNKSLIFTIKNEAVMLEKSIFLGGNKILENTCVTISGNLVNKDKAIHWEIRKNI
ncbi:heparinase II/III family protein [Pelagibacteraceae bacterium]|nr:heparinase II/III family protein [Pelagibacteraceae bacterium]